MFVENAAEIQGIFIPYNSPDFRYRVSCGLQKHLRICHADGDNILQRRGFGIFLKIAYKPADAHPPGCGIFFDV